MLSQVVSQRQVESKTVFVPWSFCRYSKQLFLTLWHLCWLDNCVIQKSSNPSDTGKCIIIQALTCLPFFLKYLLMLWCLCIAMILISAYLPSHAFSAVKSGQTSCLQQFLISCSVVLGYTCFKWGKNSQHCLSWFACGMLKC